MNLYHSWEGCFWYITGQEVNSLNTDNQFLAVGALQNILILHVTHFKVFKSGIWSMCSCIMFLENIFAKHSIYDVQTLHEDTVDLLTVSCILYRLVYSNWCHVGLIQSRLCRSWTMWSYIKDSKHQVIFKGNSAFIFKCWSDSVTEL